MSISDVVLVQKTHLDIGFTDLPSRVVETYLRVFIPGAIDLARRLADAPADGPRFVWTTGSWLIWTALEQADASHRREMESAIAAGWLRWHALPFTTHTELADPLLIRAGLGISQSLDARFGLSTRAAKMTDVPGHSIGLVPLLAEAGVRLLHLGVNPASRLPQVPEAFRWRAADGSEVTVIYGSGYGDACHIPGSTAALAFLHTNDNLGPPSLATLAAEYAALAARFPGARIFAGTLEDAVERLDPIGLPVVEAEIGDSWLHGVGSAPQRTADLLALRRGLAGSPPMFDRDAAARSGLLVCEHTWGLDGKAWLPCHEALGPAAFAHERRRHAWDALHQAYAEQNAYITTAVAAAGHQLRPSLETALAASRAARCLPQPGPQAEPCDRWAAMTTPRWIVRFDPSNGVFRQLYDRHLDVDLCAGQPGGRLGILRYEVLSDRRFRDWADSYLLPDEGLWWAVEDFGGPRQTEHFPEDLVLPTRADHLWIERRAEGTVFTVHHGFRHPRAAETGAPPLIGIQWHLPDDPAAEIAVTIGWDEKPAALVREALWFGWRQGTAVAPHQVLMDKLGLRIDAGQVVDDGGLLHAADGITIVSDRVQTRIRNLDAPLVCPDGPRLLERRLGAPDFNRGQWLNLLNTGWSTNFSFWTEGAMGWRLRIALSAAE